jgi:peptidoglycan/LPS O-acetylase OafA/YrhL
MADSVSQPTAANERPSKAVDAATHLDEHKRIPALDGLRGIAILAVFFRHYAGGLERTASSSALHALGMLFNFGWSGVDLFFVLSGFLITGILFDTQVKPGYYQNFYARRVLRIFPPYYLLAAMYLGLTPLLAAHWKWGQLSFLIYLGYPLALIWPGLAEVSPSVHITHLWSLCAEEQFYLIWPWTISKLRTTRAILRVCLALAVGTLLLRIAICVTGWVDITWTHDFLGCRMDALAIGAAIAIAVRGPLKNHLMKWAPIIFPLAAATVIAICLFRRTTDHSDPAIATFGFTLIALAYGALLVLALRQGTCLERLLSTRVLRLFGKYSYAMYLFDFPLTVFLSPKRELFIAATHSYAIGSAAFLLVCLLVNLLLAAASFHFVEAPIMRLKARFKYA